MSKVGRNLTFSVYCLLSSLSPIHSLTHLLTHSFTHSLIYSLIHSLTHQLTHSLTHSFTHSLIHSFFDNLPSMYVCLWSHQTVSSYYDPKSVTPSWRTWIDTRSTSQVGLLYRSVVAVTLRVELNKRLFGRWSRVGYSQHWASKQTSRLSHRASR